MQDKPDKKHSPPPLSADAEPQAVPVEVLPPEPPARRDAGPQPEPRPRFSRKRLALAFTIAAASDLLSVWLTFAPPGQWVMDLATAFLLFMVLGWQWILLPGLLMEAIPGIYVFPFWVLVVSAVAVWGTARPKPNQMGEFKSYEDDDAQRSDEPAGGPQGRSPGHGRGRPASRFDR